MSPPASPSRFVKNYFAKTSLLSDPCSVPCCCSGIPYRMRLSLMSRYSPSRTRSLNDSCFASSDFYFFLHLVRALSLQLCVVFLLCLGSSMWSILIVLENPDSPPLQGTDKFAIHALCTEFVGL